MKSILNMSRFCLLIGAAWTVAACAQPATSARTTTTTTKPARMKMTGNRSADPFADPNAPSNNGTTSASGM